MFIVIVIVIVTVQLRVFKRITLICEIRLISVITLVCVILHVLENTLKYSLNDAYSFLFHQTIFICQLYYIIHLHKTYFYTVSRWVAEIASWAME